MRTLTLITVGLAALVLASPLSATPSSKLVAATITVHNSRYGHILFDGRGFVLYAFTRDTRGHSSCYGACARAWPPYLVKRPLKPASGVSIAGRHDEAPWRLPAADLRRSPLVLLRRRSQTEADPVPERV